MDADALKALREPFGPEAINQIPKGGVKLDYVGHAWVTDRLLSVDPEWSWKPLAFTAEGAPLVKTHDGIAVMWIELTVCGVTRLGVGTCADNKSEVEKELIGDAIRNAAMRFGVALDLWKKEAPSDQGAPERNHGSGERPARASGGDGGRKATEKQVKYLSSLLDDRVLPDGFQVPVLDGISMRECSAAIDVLKDAPEVPKAARGRTVADAVKALGGEVADGEPPEDGTESF